MKTLTASNPLFWPSPELEPTIYGSYTLPPDKSIPELFITEPEIVPRLSPEQCLLMAIIEGFVSISNPIGERGIALFRYGIRETRQLFLETEILNIDSGDLCYKLSLAEPVKNDELDCWEGGKPVACISLLPCVAKVFHTEDEKLSEDKKLLAFIKEYQLLEFLERLADYRSKQNMYFNS